MGFVYISPTGAFTTTSSAQFTFHNGIVNDGVFSKTGTQTVRFASNNQSLSGTNPVILNGIINITGITLTNMLDSLVFQREATNAVTGT